MTLCVFLAVRYSCSPPLLHFGVESKVVRWCAFNIGFGEGGHKCFFPKKPTRISPTVLLVVLLFLSNFPDFDIHHRWPNHNNCSKDK